MTSKRPASRAPTWCWRRWIESTREDAWVEKLRLEGVVSWTLTGKPDRKRTLVTVYAKDRRETLGLRRKFGGQTRLLHAAEWMTLRPSPPLRIGPQLRIVHEKPRPRDNAQGGQLHIPHGLAFGSGEHATTSMLLRALVRFPNLSERTVLDLGTGSGILALAARLRGAKKVVATDWDAEAVRTARQNELLNFREPFIRWRQADVKVLSPQPRYDLVLANLFSGILCEASVPIAAAVAPAGQLWLSGILRTQEEQVIAAFQRTQLRLLHSARRGKWIMLQWGAETR